MSDWEMPEAMIVGPVALRVAAFDPMVAFYQKVVGMDVRRQTGESTVLGIGETDLLHLLETPTGQSRPREAAGLYHFGIRLPSREALGSALHRINQVQALDGASDHGVSEALYLSDPEGNGVELYCDRPRSAWPRQEGNIHMTTEPLHTESLQTVGRETENLPPDATMGHVHLEVTDLDQSIPFYGDRLGLTSTYAVPNGVFMAAGTYHHHIGLNTWRRRTSPATDSLGLAWLSMILPSRDVQTLKAHLSVESEPDGPAAITITDPDEIPIKVFTEV